MKKNKWFLIPGFCLLTSFFLAAGFFVVQAATAGNDAIGVRVLPNPNHYSVYRWYESQGFSGSPQALTVDGYEAVRDGRTVYVNAANIDPESKTIYTNIYLISYNQDPAAKTADILGQLVSHWKFNNNLFENANPAPTCAISSLGCASDADCSSGQACATSTVASSSCVLKSPKNCLTDSDCPKSFFCNSVKAKITRDLKRLGKLAELKESLFSFKSANGHYPALAAGSYLANHAVSVWPSWTENLLADLAVAKSFSDPINRLGHCAGYDFKTCWNKETKRFVYDPMPTYLMLPFGSYAMVYKTDANGSNYSLCAVMESREPSLNYHFYQDDPNSSNCVTATGIIAGGEASNTPPILVEKSLTGEAGQEFNGFVKAIDQEGNPLSWSLVTSGTNWTGWKNNNTNNQPPSLKDTNSPNQKRIYAQKAGPAGTYSATLNISDGQGGVISTSTPLKIMNSTLFIEASDGEYVLDPSIPFGYRFSFFGKNISNPSTAYSLTKVSGPFDLLASSFLTKTFSSIGINRYQVSFQGIFPATSQYQFSSNTDFVYQVKVVDGFNSSSTKRFRIRLLPENPQLSFNCQAAARINKAYSCYLGRTRQGAHTLAYYSNTLPTGLSLQSLVVENIATGTAVTAFNSRSLRPLSFWHGVLHSLADLIYKSPAVGAASGPGENGIVYPVTGTSSVISDIYLKGVPTVFSTGTLISVKAINEYGASSTRAFTLKINNYCGDGQKQSPNGEGRGGIYNDGYEDCDGNSGVTNDPANSSLEVQYGCVTGVGAITPNPIVSNNYCVFKPVLEGGGYCGDGNCQGAIETKNNCSADCAQENITCTPDCEGKECGSDGCGGTCDPGCPTGKNCSSGKCIQNSCGNGNCQSNTGENCQSCPDDCVCSGSTPVCNSSGQCVANSTNCNGQSGCKICGGTTGCTCPAGMLCKDGICYFKNTCKCSTSTVSSTLDICIAPDPANNTCCKNLTETCCGGTCLNDPNKLKETCGYTCCTKATQTCCGSTLTNKTCRNNNSLVQCGADYCCPGQICCNNQYCVSNGVQCDINQD